MTVHSQHYIILEINIVRLSPAVLVCVSVQHVIASTVFESSPLRQHIAKLT